tara:strand:- start:301 stop:546 length:246 start_codon:yes stop_codon:yes gene_type:complete
MEFKVKKHSGFRFVESDEPTLTDDMYELIDNDNITIQVSEIGYIVNMFVEDENDYDESYSVDCGIFKSLSKAKAKCVLLNN